MCWLKMFQVIPLAQGFSVSVSQFSKELITHPDLGITGPPVTMELTLPEFLIPLQQILNLPLPTINKKPK